MVIKPLEGDHTPGTVKPFQVSLVEPVACSSSQINSTDPYCAATVGGQYGNEISYEETASLLQQAFEGLIWGLKQRAGRARPEAVIGDPRLLKHLGRTQVALGKTVARLDQAMALLRNQAFLDAALFVEPLARLREDVIAAEKSERDLARAVLDRHARVQREKRKAQWIERESHWTLMPGENRVSGDAPPDFKGSYLHPFKVTNAYAILADLGRVRLEDRNAEE